MKFFWYNGSKNIIGQRLKEARINANPVITQSDLSARLQSMGYSIDRVAISKIESGDRFVADYEVVALANALKISVSWLLSGKQ